MRTGNGERPANRPIRCAIYTRKSHEEGLDQEFNSLDAQRESAEAYAKSQAQEGWVVLPTRYDDGGFSGATIERPAMKRLMEDVEAGRVDCVVVYKVDRLSRALLDFARLVEIFDRKGVSFVSVTQQFNTTTSMGRLTLNVLLSFAQFEREVIGERIRDKFAASRRRGKHMGGPPVLGYDIDRAQKRLVVHPREASLVRHIFERFVELGSATKLVQELNAAGHRTKSWTTVKGKTRVGTPWHKGLLYRLLNNCLYVGEVCHRGERHAGEQEAIVDREAWEKVHKILAGNHHAKVVERRTRGQALLRGLVRCAPCGCGMTAHFSIRRGKICRYYLCLKASKLGATSCPVRRVAAGELEQVVTDQLRAVLRAPEEILQSLRPASCQDPAGRMGAGEGGARSNGGPEDSSISVLSEPTLRVAAGRVEGLWDDLFPAERERIVRLLVDEIKLGPERMVLAVSLEGWRSLAQEVGVEDHGGGGQA